MNRNASILIADDNPENLKVLSSILKKEGYNVRAVINGFQAVESVKLMPPDLIMLDIQMPIMDGYKACEEIKALDNLRDIPIIFISAMSVAFNKVKAFNLGAADYIEKPFQIEEVVSRVNTQLKIAFQKKQLKAVNVQLFEQFRSTFEQSAIGIVHFSLNDYRITKVNQGFCEFIGHSEEELLDSQYLSLSVSDTLHDQFKRVLNGEIKSFSAEKKYKTKDFKTVWGRQTITLVSYPQSEIDNHWVAFVTDITKQKEIEDRNYRLNGVLDRSSNIAAFTDIHGCFEYVNSAFIKATQLKLEDVKGKIAPILNSNVNDQSESIWLKLKQKNDWRGEFLNKRKNGEEYWERVNISPLLDDEGIITNLLILANDISSEKRMIEDLKIAKEKAEEADKLKSSFLASISHEIRTPLNSIIGFSSLIAQVNNDPEMIEYSEILSQQSDHLLQLINEIVEFAKIESGVVNIQESIFDVNTVLKNTFAIFESKCNPQTTLILDIPDYPFVIKSDKIKLEQVIYNLVANAVKFTEKGSITIGILGEENDDFIFYVKDAGIGIPEDKCDDIFNRFFKLDDFTPGVGLGLSIVSNLLKLLKGKIWLESLEGVGSIFYFSLPVKMKYLEEHSTLNIEMDEFSYKDLDVLVVEHNQENFEYVQNILEKNNINAFHADSKEKVISYCRENENLKIVLVDLKIPVLNGFEIIKKMKEINPNLGIIALSSHSLVEDEKKARSLGCNGFITKPFHLVTLLKAISQCFK
jgi:PAS domain S-box-containing protein